MNVDDQLIDLEVQVVDKKDYPVRSLYYWARVFSSALKSSKEYIKLPRTIVISILNFKQFECDEYYSEYRVLEVTRHTALTDKLCMKYYELPKLPEIIDTSDELKLWLLLFNAKTVEDLNHIEAMEVPIMKQAIDAYKSTTSTEEFQRLEEMRFDASCIEASALGHARREEAKKWQELIANVVAEKDVKLANIVAEKDAKLVNIVAEKDAMLADKDAILAEKDARLADKDTEIMKLKAQLGI